MSQLLSLQHIRTLQLTTPLWAGKANAGPPGAAAHLPWRSPLLHVLLVLTGTQSTGADNTFRSRLDPFRSRLDPEMVEALICTKDWVASERRGILVGFVSLVASLY